MNSSFTPHIPFGLDPMWVSALVLALSYALIISGRLNRAVVALIGASIAILVGALDQKQTIDKSHCYAVGVTERSGVRVSFVQYLAYGVPMTLGAIGICHIYVWLRYF